MVEGAVQSVQMARERKMSEWVEKNRREGIFIILRRTKSIATERFRSDGLSRDMKFSMKNVFFRFLVFSFIIPFQFICNEDNVSDDDQEDGQTEWNVNRM